MKPILSTLVAVLTALVALSAGAAFEQQLEADWLLQAEFRFGPAPQANGASKVRLEEDAAGAVDGIVNGEWGFHTALEGTPWWQVDLVRTAAIDRVVLYNRCGAMAIRASRIKVLVGTESRSLRQVYQHDGTVFHGHSDKKPLVIALNGVKARYVRLQLPQAKVYFHLDEVRIHAVGSGENVALNKPATQSSLSQWSKGKQAAAAAPTSDWLRAARTTLERGRRLARALDRLGAPTRHATDRLLEIEDRLDAAPAPGNEQLKQLYLEARRTVRRLALSNPLLDFDTLLFVKRAPTMFPHLSDQYYGWWSRPGGGVFVLQGLKEDQPRAVCLTGDLPPGNALRPDLSYDGERVLFAHCRFYPEAANVSDKVNKGNLQEDGFYHLYEMRIDGSERRRLTRGKYDDFDGRYLPNGDIAFLSTRKGTFLQCTQANTQRTLSETLPDSYVRCGGGNARPVPVFTLHAMDGNGGNMRPISAFETFEYTPSVANDGRILYCRWDYIDRFNGHFFSLWSTNPDGSNAQLVYGNYTKRPQATMEPRSIPGSHKIIFTASAHHSITGGSLVLLDRNKGLEGDAPITRLTPEVPFPETEKNVGMFYANPWPLSENFCLVSWSNRKLPAHTRRTDDRNPVNAQGLYLYDRFGNLELLYREEDISSMTPIPVRPRQKPAVYPDTHDPDVAQVGTFTVRNVYAGLEGVARGTVARIRIVGVPPKVQPHMNRPSLGVSREETGKYVLGSVPVEADGSAHFRVPSGVPVFFQALDVQGRAVQTMRSLTYVQPDRALSCIGCHEHRNASPATGDTPLALRRGPSPLTPGPEGTLPLRYDTLVQRVLNRHCVQCHNAANAKSPAHRLVLTADASYKTLIGYAKDDLKKLVFERDYSEDNHGPALDAKLFKHLETHDAHRDLKLSDDAMRRLYAWVDTYGHTQGCFSPEQERELVAWAAQYAELFEPRSGKN